MRIQKHLPSLCIFILSYLVKEYKIEKGNYILWDEAHFMKFASFYIQRKFYFDVHPPLGKMMTALGGLLFNLTEKYAENDEFPLDFDYAGMRRFHAFIGSFLPLFVYLILRQFRFSTRRSMLCALLFIFENGFTSITRIVLLDSHLLTFTAGVTYYLVLLYKDLTRIRDFAIDYIEDKDSEYIDDKDSEYIEDKDSEHIEDNHSEHIDDNYTVDRKLDHAISEKTTKRTVSNDAGNKDLIVRDALVNFKCINKANNTLPYKSKQDKINNIFYDKKYRTGPLNSINLLKLGCMLGCVISVKWIGCLTMLLVGIYVIYDLFNKLISYSMKEIFSDFIKYAVFLIAVPATIYITCFQIHFLILNKSGTGDGEMSIPFQLRLSDNPLRNGRKYITFGKQVTIHGTGGYIHSHQHNYPEDADSGLLQVTTYGAKDANNNFYFQRVSNTEVSDFLKNSDHVVILHAETESYIQADKQEAYLSDGFRVSCKVGSPVTESVWIVERKDDSFEKEDNIKALTTNFYLRNKQNNCYLSVSNEKYPSWGFGQGKIVCKKQKNYMCIWKIEENLWADAKNNPIYSGLKKSFISSFLELNNKMYQSNKAMKLDTNLEPDRIISTPLEWPVLKRGIRMSQWHEKHKFYMFMNPLILYSASLFLVISPLIFLYRHAMNKREFESLKTTFKSLNEKNTGNGENIKGIWKQICKNIRKRNLLKDEGFFIFLTSCGWGIHYFAFYCVGRVLYFHHYFPSFLYSILSLCYCLKFIKFQYALVFVGMAIICYGLYSPLTYGFIDQKQVSYLKILPEWDFID